MQINDFINKYNNKQVEAGGSSGAIYQCVDLINQYLGEFGYKRILGTDAKNFISPLKAQGFTQVTSPQAGDIAIWNWGIHGHIAIYIGNGQYLTQNYPLKLKTTIAKLNNNGLMGYLRPKQEGLTMGQYEELQGYINDLTNARNEDVKFNQDTRKYVNDISDKLNEIQTKLDNLTNCNCDGTYELKKK